MTARSLRRDLALGLGAGLTVLWIVAMLGAALIVREELDEVYDSLMEETADRLLPFMAGPESPALPPRAEALLARLYPAAAHLVRAADAVSEGERALVEPAGEPHGERDQRRHEDQ